MILLLLSGSLLASFLLDSRRLPFYVVVYFVLFDMFDGFYEDEKIFAAIKYLLPLGLLTLSFIKTSAIRNADQMLLMLIAFLFALLLYSPGDIVVSVRNVFAVMLTVLMIPAGRQLARNGNFLSEFQPFNRFLLMAIPLYIVAANIFHFGESYSDEFTTGFLITSRMYVLPIVVFMATHYLLARKVNGVLFTVTDVLFTLLSLAILIINTRRTALGMVAFSFLIYPFYNRRVAGKMILFLVVVIGGLIVSYPFYEKQLTAQLEKRDRIQDLETYEEEGRYLETLYILDYHGRHQRISEVLLGIKLFDTYDFGVRYFGRDRPIHSDINMLFFSTGLIGLVVFGIFFLRYFFIGNGRIDRTNRMVYYPLLLMLVMVLIPGRFIGTMTFAPLLILLLAGSKYEQSSPLLITERENQASLNAEPILL